MHVGNARYVKREDLPETIPVFPLTGALLLPGGQLPLNVFEPRYLAMFDAALAGNRLIGMIQPVLGEGGEGIRPALSSVGCIGRITSFAETGDGPLHHVAEWCVSFPLDGGGWRRPSLSHRALHAVYERPLL